MATLRLVLPCVLLLLLLPLVKTDYNCSRPNMVIDTYSFDFLRTFSKAANTLSNQAPKSVDRFMNLTLASKDTKRNVVMWSQCNKNDTEKLCTSCINIMLTSIYEVCCQQKSSWGTMNLRTSCTVGYSAPDYVIPGWTDPDDLPKAIQKKPDPFDLNAAQTLAPSHIVFHLVTSTIACIFSILFGMH